MTDNKTLRIALLGNPNAGKSSLFNGLTGLHQKTGNYSGVTVDRYEGTDRFERDGHSYELNIIDLPGLYSLFPKSEDERVACRTLLEDKESIDVVVVVADSTNLKRNLLLATQLIDLKFPTVVALSFKDEAASQGIQIDIAALSSSLGVEVVPIDSRHQEGFEELRTAIVNARVSDSIFYDIGNKEFSGGYRNFIRAALTRKDPSQENTDKIHRFSLINYLMVKTVKSPELLSRRYISSRIDAVITHRVFGYVILVAILFLLFQFIFYVSEIPMKWIEDGFISMGETLSAKMPDNWFSEMLINGLLPGISGVVMFVPQIAILFLFIGVLEDSGYMARASFIMDRVLRPFGLNGRSVIPLISGAACAVPAIMATRTIGNMRERLLTIFILPLISCSARLPVYTLLISVLYPEHTMFGIFNARGVALFALYLLGFAASLLTAFALKHLFSLKEKSYFVLELPVYRWPQLKNVAILVYNKVKVFIGEAGKVILAISIVLWFLSTHGAGETFNKLEAQEKELVRSGEEGEQLKTVRAAKLEASFIGKVGHAIEPVIRPIGFDWKIGIALVTSFAAREVFVGTMATIYQAESTDEPTGIRDRIKNEKDENGRPIYTAAVCWSLLLFYAFALQCMSTVAVARRESGSWKWVSVQFLFMFSLAYFSAYTAFHLLS